MTQHVTSQFVSSPDLCHCVYACVPQNTYNPQDRCSISILDAINIEEKVCGLLLCNTCVCVFCIGVKGVYLCLFADAGWAQRSTMGFKYVKLESELMRDYLIIQKTLQSKLLI